ncbi:uncharacterized protein B0T23DRAFT_456876 [Neurospora hispaniola]|uniref:Uncharacterized protein n=1 Tax=Neurospora hispaniola TaxID=588809 RepID=A0AAJ0MMC0_9PEZI|nr:hypothetical protein B0T23DRAFT_456876 [Neurospora hispaniola]
MDSFFLDLLFVAITPAAIVVVMIISCLIMFIVFGGIGMIGYGIVSLFSNAQRRLGRGRCGDFLVINGVTQSSWVRANEQITPNKRFWKEYADFEYNDFWERAEDPEVDFNSSEVGEASARAPRSTAKDSAVFAAPPRAERIAEETPDEKKKRQFDDNKWRRDRDAVETPEARQTRLAKQTAWAFLWLCASA